MQVPFKARNISTWVVIPSAMIVAALALLEYRWSTSVSEATAVRLADSLQMSMINWQKDFFRYFSEIGLALRIDPVEDVPGDVGQYAPRLESSSQISESGFERLPPESGSIGEDTCAQARFTGDAFHSSGVASAV